MSHAGPEAVLFPYAVLVDQREKAPYSFTGLLADAREGRKPLRIVTRTKKLETGDYALAGLEDVIAVEKKTLPDLYHTLGQARGRFERELTRLSAMEVAAVVVEAEWSTILNHPPETSQLPPKVVFRSVLAWQQQFPTIHWWFVDGRRPAEVVTFRILERFARRRQETRRPKQKRKQEDVRQGES
jgi:ERCC4-type nuclease